MWKVYNIATGRIVKAGFESDDQAKDWLERRKDLADDEFDIDEMDEEEEEEYLESEDEEDEEVASSVEVDAEDDEGLRDINYPDDDDIGGDDEEDEEDDEEEEDEVEADAGEDEDY